MPAEKNTHAKRGRPKIFCRAESLDRAMALFIQKGYEATSVADLSKTMGMNPPSLYNAFGDKESLFIEVLDHFHAPYRSKLEEIFSATTTTTEAIKNALNLSRSHLSCDQSEGCLIVNSCIQVMKKDEEENSAIAQKLVSLHDIICDLINERLKKGQEQGEIPSTTDTNKLTSYIYGLSQGAAVLARGQRSPTAATDLLDQGYQAFLALIKP